MEPTESLEWLGEHSTRSSYLQTDNASTDAPDTSTGPYCQVCSHVKTLPKNVFALQLLFPAVTLTANLLTTVAIYQSRQMKASLRLNLLNLSFTDIAGSLTYMYNIAFSWTRFQVDAECIARYVLFVTTQVLTLTTIHLMSIDRCLALMSPYLYERFAGSNYVKVSVAVNWCFSLTLVAIGFSQVDPHAEGCFYPLLFRPFTHAFYATSGLLAISNIVLLNTVLFAKARVQIRKIGATMVAGEERDREISRMEIKSALTTVSVVVPYVTLNTPMYILMMLFFVRGASFTHRSDALFLINAFSSLALLNGLVNPGVYIWRSQMVRDKIWQILGPLRVLRSRPCLLCGQKADETASVEPQPAVARKGPSSCSAASTLGTLSVRPSLDSDVCSM